MIKTIDKNLRHGYSTRPAFSCDEEHLLLYGNGVHVYKRESLKRVDTVPFTTESHWSKRHADGIWGCKWDNGSVSSFGLYHFKTKKYIEYFNGNTYFKTKGVKLRIGPYKGVVQDDRWVVLHATYNGKTKLVSLDLSKRPAIVRGTMTPSKTLNFSAISPNGKYVNFKDKDKSKATNVMIMNGELDKVVYSDKLPGGDIKLSHSDWVVAEDCAVVNEAGIQCRAGS